MYLSPLIQSGVTLANQCQQRHPLTCQTCRDVTAHRLRNGRKDVLTMMSKTFNRTLTDIATCSLLCVPRMDLHMNMWVKSVGQSSWWLSWMCRAALCCAVCLPADREQRAFCESRGTTVRERSLRQMDDREGVKRNGKWERKTHQSLPNSDWGVRFLSGC